MSVLETVMAGYLQDLQDGAAAATWVVSTPPELCANDPSARLFTGHVGAWRVLLVSYALSDARSRGYDGTATRAGVVMRLPREVAEHIGKIADRSLDS
jgi:hypothetical protein